MEIQQISDEFIGAFHKQAWKLPNGQKLIKISYSSNTIGICDPLRELLPMENKFYIPSL